MNRPDAALSRPKEIVMIALLVGLGVLGVVTATTGDVWVGLAISSGTILWLVSSLQRLFRRRG
jgi:hypothetical protein